jgi:hypothetical protein
MMVADHLACTIRMADSKLLVSAYCSQARNKRDILRQSRMPSARDAVADRHQMDTMIRGRLFSSPRAAPLTGSIHSGPNCSPSLEQSLEASAMNNSKAHSGLHLALTPFFFTWPFNNTNTLIQVAVVAFSG